MISFITSVALLSSIAVPALAMVAPDAVTNRFSRRLLEAKTRAEQRVPVAGVEASLRVRERKQAMKDVTGRSDLGRSQITTRIRTIRGTSPEVRSIYWKSGRPSRRSILQDADQSLLELPPTLVETGGKGSRNFVRMSGRLVRAKARVDNVVKVQAVLDR